MTIGEKVAYLKGLAEGMAFDPESKKGRMFSGILDVLSDIAADLEDLEDNNLDVWEEIDAINEDLDIIEDDFYGDDEDDDEDPCMLCEGCEDYEESEDDEDPVFYEVECPACENTITIDEDVLELGSIECPNCGSKLDFDLDSIEDIEDEEEEEDAEEAAE
ncbi:MAG: CD1247 N-terminal domain-containing protein [Oscillospiraceae bacterium]